MSGMVNGKHLNQVGIELDFNANTSKAKKEIQNLQRQLDNVLKNASKSTGEFSLNEELHEASKAAIELKRHLSNAFDIDTNKFNISKFNKSLQQSEKTLEHYRIQMNKLEGGREAFNSLAKSIINAEVPLKRANKLVQEFGVTLKNTARWQISSSILHGFMGTIQSAFHYAEDLNRSLNNIRIVTGQNTEQMAAFAKQANESAKALSTTTTKYTDAALIYYQQGLSDKEVKERTDVTVKMANVARESAEEVSNQMTAVWNNFNKDGTQAAESFADKMTALGAATASSTSEIAEGLSKFAGIADTIGLSFDYASSALATVTATSRESADVVGTAFKTIFARMEGLKQGKTDEDGTDLNKYSEGLAKIGVQIKDQNGDLKTMDTILENMGEKWQGLTRDQKIATAQTVAGVRQYNQLMTLMDNWDFFQKNLGTARGAEGTLQKQADIYAESWEAARDRVTAAAEEIYSQLLNDDFFIGLNNGFAGFLGIISNTIDALGGLQGVLSGIGLLVTNLYKEQMAGAVNSFFDTQKKRREEWAQSQEAATDALFKNAEGDEVKMAYSYVDSATKDLLKNSEKLTVEQEKQARLELEQLQNRAKAVEDYSTELKIAKEIEKTRKASAKKATNTANLEGNRRRTQKQEIIGSFGENKDKQGQVKQALDDFDKMATSQEHFSTATAKATVEYEKLVEAIGKNRANSYVQTRNQEAEALRAEAIEAENLATATQDVANKEVILAEATKDAESASANFSEGLKNMKEKPAEIGDVIVGLGQGIMSLSMAWSSLSGLEDIWSDNEVSTGEKLLSTITSMSMVTPMLISGFKGLKEGIEGFGPAVVKMAIEAGVAEEGATIATIGWGTALKGVAATLAPMLGPIAIAIAGATALGVAISVISDEWNKEANAAKEAAEAASGLQDELNTVKSAYDDIKDTLSSYNDARSALKDMTVGTQEWKQAVIELNQQVLELISKYPEIANFVQNKNGILDINAEGQQQILDTQLEKIEQAQKASIAGQIVSNQAAEKDTITQEARKKTGNDSEFAAVVSKIAGFIPGSSTGVAQDLKDRATEEYADQLTALVDAYERNGEAVFLNTEALASNSEETKNNFEETKNLVRELAASREAPKEESRQVVGQILESKNFEGSETFSKFLASGEYGKRLQKNIEKYSDDGDMTDEEAQKKYAKMMGYKHISNDGDDKGTYLVNGEEKQISDVIAREAIAIHKTEESLGNDLEKLREKFEKLEKGIQDAIGGSTEDADHVIEFLKGDLNFDDLTQAEIDALIESKDKIKEFALDHKKDLGLKKKEIEDVVGKLDNDDLKNDVENYVKQFPQSVQQAFNSLDSDEMTTGGRKALADTINKAMVLGGEDAQKSLNTIFDKAQDKGKVKEFGKLLDDIDWETTDVETFKDSLKEVGITTDLTDKEFEGLINSMRNTALETDSLSEKYGKVHKVIDGLKEGDTISPEQYKDLGEYAKDYFTEMLDGTYKLTTDAEKFYKATEKGLIKEAKQDLDTKNEKLTSLSAIDQNKDVYNFDQLSKQQSYNKNDGNSIVNIEKQIELVKALGDESEETQNKIKEWQYALDHQEVTTEMTKELADNVSGLREEYEKIPEKIKEVNEERLKEIQAIYETANSIEELDEKTKQVGLDQDLYNKKVLEIRGKERVADLDTEDIKDYGKYLQDLANSEQKAKVGTQELDDKVGKFSKRAKSLATQIQRMNKGVESLSSNWKTWSKILKQGSEGADEHRKAVQGTRTAIADLADVSEDYVSIDFVESMADNAENMKLMEKAARGDGKAIDELKSKLSDDIVQNVILKKNKFDGTKQELLTEHEQLKKLLSKQLNLKIGAKIDSKFTKEANEFIKKSKMTVDQANSYFRSLGVEPHFKTVYKTVKTKKPIIQTDTTLKPKDFKINHPGNEHETGWQETVKGYTKTETSRIVGYKSVDEKVAVPAIRSDGKEPAVTFTSLGNGSVNNSSSANPGGGSPSGGGNNSHNNSRRGGGGRAKKMTKMKKDKSKPEKRDPYWDENLAISRTSREINKTEQESTYKYGKQKVKLLEKQNELLQKQLKNYQALGKEQARQEKALRKQAKKAIKKDKNKNLKGSGLGLKVKYDKDGYVSNYDGLMDQSNKRYKKQQKKYNKYLKEYNKFVKQYNNIQKSTTAAQKQAKTKEEKKYLKLIKKDLDKRRKSMEKKRKLMENELKAEKELYKKRMDWIDKYTETEEAKQERKEQERELKREIIENNIEKWDVEIQLKIDTREAKREWDKFIKKMEKAVKTTTSHFHISEAADKVTGNRDTLKDFTQDYKNKAEQMKTYDWISKNWDQYTKLVPESKRIASSASEAAEKANEYKKELEDIGENAMAELQEGWNTYLDSINEGIEAIDALNDKLKTQGEILDYGRQMIEMVYGGKAYDKMDAYYKTQDKYLTTQQSTLKEQQEMYQRLFDKELAKAKAEDPTVDENNYLTWTDAMIAYYNAAQNAASQLRDTNLAYVQNQIDAYNNLVDAQMDSLERSLTGGSLLDEEIAKWERKKKEMDLYLDEQERTYQIQSLLNKYDNTINTTKDLEMAKKLKKIKDEELQQLIEKGKLTKFDLDVANARYNVELKKIALEEAQKNKNSMKLSRNADGNWSYQYVANQDDIKNKGQELLDATNEWYEKSKDNQRRIKDTILSTWQEVIPQITEILKDQSLTVEERIKKSEELAEWATRMSGSLADENCVSIQNMLAANAATLIAAYETDSQSFEQYNKDKTGFIETFKQEGISDFYDLFDKFGIYAKGGATKLVEALATGKDAALPKIVTESYKSLIGGANTSSVLGAFNKAGDTIIKNFVTNKSSVYNQLTTTFGKIAKAGESCLNKISGYIPEVMDSFNEVWLALDNINTEMGTVTETVESNLDSIRNKIYNKLIPAWNDYWNAVNQSKEDTEQEDGENPPEIPEQVQQNIDMSENKDVQKLMNPKYKYKAKKGKIKENKNAVWSYGIVDVVGDYAIEKTKDGKKYKVIDMVTGKTKKTCKSLNAARDKAYGLWNKTLDKLQKDPLVQEAAQYGVDVLGERMHAGANYVGNKGITDIYEKKKKNGGMISAIFSDSIHFDTGGYTGDWGNDGKIAVLHQKELVLNQEDTNNILDAVNGIRDISSLNGSISNAITDSISGIFADSIKNAVGQTIGINTQKQNETYTIENITAEFPNAQNVDDIREAILSLPRLASQYVARNLK